jgi:hypothetical protein
MLSGSEIEVTAAGSGYRAMSWLRESALLNLKLRVLMPVFDKLSVLRIIHSVGVRCYFAQMFRCFVLRVGEERVVLFRDAAGKLFLHTHGLLAAFTF